MSVASQLPADLKNRVALVTGASRGIGRGIAIKLGSLGANVVVNYSGNKQAADETVQLVQKHGVKAIAVQADVSDPKAASELVKRTVEAFGRLDVVVNNAGAFSGGAIQDVTDQEYHKVLGINVGGTFYVTRAAVPHIPEHGAIINISSVISKAPFPNTSVYTLSKGAVEAFTRALAVELGPRKIRVNTVSPGTTESDMLRADGDAFAQFGVGASLLKRLGYPDDIAEAVAFLAVPRSGAWITGQNIVSSGGLTFSN
ncbi:oxidoreductase [Gorgonomyces haynaldii]|nr:oxidoreductase [Gorgonomyces haynaldii]KAI8908569.1 oxidoreductase [Gorgonomyces haynaldii]